MVRMGGECQLIFDGGVLYSICSTSTSSRSQVVMLAECVATANTTDRIEMNIGNPKKYVDILKNIPDATVSLIYDGASLFYSNPSSDALVREFRFVLLSDPPSAIYSRETINGIVYNTSASLSLDNLRRIYQLSSTSSIPNKMYVETSGKALRCTLTDRSYDGADSIAFTLAEAYSGSQISNVIISSDVLPYVVGCLDSGSECGISFSNNKIVTFDIKNYAGEGDTRRLVSHIMYLTPTRVER